MEATTGNDERSWLYGTPDILQTLLNVACGTLFHRGRDMLTV
jgi:hypothetical protein